MIMLVANPLVNTLLWVMIGIIVLIAIWAVWELIKWLRSDTLIFVNKERIVGKIVTLNIALQV